MKIKKCFITISAVFLLGWLSQLNWSQTTSDLNESKLKKFEIGGQFTILQRTDANTPAETFRRFGFASSADNPATITELGVGGRFTYNFTKNIAIEAEANFFPVDKKSDFIIGVPVRVVEPGGRKFQAVLGPKIGIRKRKFGVFAKVRPGLFSMDRYEVVQVVGTRDNFFVLATSKNGVNFFNVDVGGVFEYYPSKKTVFRVDVGDTIIRYSAQEPKDINPSFTRHNLQINVGFGFRF